MLLQILFDVHGEFYCYKMLWTWKFPHSLLLQRRRVPNIWTLVFQIQDFTFWSGLRPQIYKALNIEGQFLTNK